MATREELRALTSEVQAVGRDQQSMQFAAQTIENQLNQALQFVQSSVSPSEAQRLANPSVVHADFSTFRGYSPGGCSE